jgi:hypothetical protein
MDDISYDKPSSAPPAFGDPSVSFTTMRCPPAHDCARSESTSDHGCVCSMSPPLRTSRSISPSRHFWDDDYTYEDYKPRRRTKSDRSLEKVFSTAVTAIIRMRNDPGSWFGAKGLRVAFSAIAAAIIEVLLDTNPKESPLQHIAVTMMQSYVFDSITTVRTRPKSGRQ